MRPWAGSTFFKKRKRRKSTEGSKRQQVRKVRLRLGITQRRIWAHRWGGGGEPGLPKGLRGSEPSQCQDAPGGGNAGGDHLRSPQMALLQRGQPPHPHSPQCDLFLASCINCTDAGGLEGTFHLLRCRFERDQDSICAAWGFCVATIHLKFNCIKN